MLLNNHCLGLYLQSLHKLKQLDMSWNRLTSTKDELSILRKHTPHLTALDVRNNPWQKVGCCVRSYSQL